MGRRKCANCIDVSHDRHEIVNAIKMTLQDPDFRSVIAASEKPYGDAHACDKILHVIKSIDLNQDLLLKKLDMARIECTP
jgi:UDP-N-acetylglucosamine 2-epimerase